MTTSVPTPTTTLTSSEMLSAIVNLLTHVPKSTLKTNFARQASLAGDKSVAADFKAFYEQYKNSVVPKLTSSLSPDEEDADDLRRILLQLGMVSKLIGGADPADDQYSILAGCVVYVATWTQQLSKVLFPTSRSYAMTTLWSSVMDSFGVEYELQGTLPSVLLALEQYIMCDNGGQPAADTADEGEVLTAAYPPIFPGPAPVFASASLDAFASWHKFENATGPLPTEVRASFNRVFGYAETCTKIPSSHVMYINPADDTPARCVAADSWAIDSMASSLVEVEYAEDDADDEAEAAAFKEEKAKLQALGKAVPSKKSSGASSQ